MRNLYLIAIVILVSGLASCSKYPEGPGLSFRDAKVRAANIWSFESYSLNGVEKSKLTEFATQKQFWQKDGNYSHTYINPDNGVAVLVSGTWELFDNDSKVNITYTEPGSATAKVIQVYNILKLKNNEMWLRSADNSIESHLKTSN
jgi:hypothetical protein